MEKIVTIHQPNYHPWLGFFSKIKHSDIFVLLDNVKYSKNGFINRNKIRTRDGWCYLTIPIGKKFYNSKIMDVELPERTFWQEEHWQSIETNYKKAEYFLSYSDFFRNIYSKKFEYLWQINQEIILYLIKCFGIEVEIYNSSKINMCSNLSKTDLLINIIKEVRGDIYLSGPSGMDYLNTDRFEENNIELRFFRYENRVYRQRYPGFEPNMAAIDLLFNLGEKSREHI